jgi:hypothetical protein
VASRCKSRTCPACGVLWAGDQRVKLLRNVEAYGGDVALVTVTAPGADVLPWADDGTRRVDPEAARRWNLWAREGWRRMHRRAAQRADRFHRRHGGSGWRIVAKSWEFQRRGVLHRHVILPMATALDRMASERYVIALDELRHEFGFGFVDRGRKTKRHQWARQLEVVPRERAARYLAKYIAGVKSDGRLALSETVTHPDVPGHVTYVSRRLTARTRCTMTTLRAHRLLHCIAAESRIDPEELLALIQDSGVQCPRGLEPLVRGAP